MNDSIPHCIKHKHRRKCYILKILFIFLLISIHSITTFAFMETPPFISSNYIEVLLISSQNENNLWGSKVLQELAKLLEDSDLDIHVKVESISQSNRDNAYYTKQAELLKVKYNTTDFDLIIPVDDESLFFVGDYLAKNKFKDTPVVYGGINDVSKLSYYPYNKFTGVTESDNIYSLITQIYEIAHGTSEINILLDNSMASKHIEIKFRDCIPYYKDILKFNFIRSDYLSDICNEIDSNNDCPSIVVGNFRDSSDVLITPHDTISIIKQFTPNQLYTLNETYINTGVVGGSILYAKSHSKLIYDMAIRVLSGEDPQKIPRIYDSSNIYIFDSVQLENYSIPKKLLPKNSVIINESWIYKGVSMVIVVLLALTLIVVMVLLTIQTLEKKNNQKKVVATKKQYNEILVNNKIRTQFLANFSHEIRTLLNVILSGLQLLEMYKNNGRLIFTNKEDECKLVYIRQNGFRLLKLINNLIDMTKIDSGFYNVEFEMGNIVEVIEDITMSVVEYANTRGVTIIFDTNEEEVYMPLDSEKLDRIILNLLSNSIKFTPKGGYIYVTMNCSEKDISVSIKDTGVGIAKEKQDSIFERFTQINNGTGSHKEGSGIGLSLVKSLVELLDGKITLSSEPDNGCEFIFTLPIKDPEIATMEAQDHISQSINDNTEKLRLELSDIDTGV